MRKGIDHALFRKAVVDREGNVVEDKLVMLRPAHGVKELNRRYKAGKAARKVRRKQYLAAAIERRHRQRRSARG